MALIKQQFPNIDVIDEPDTKNTGNFLVKVQKYQSAAATGRQHVLWPFGFVDTAASKRVLLLRIQKYFSRK